MLEYKATTPRRASVWKKPTKPPDSISAGCLSTPFALTDSVQDSIDSTMTNRASLATKIIGICVALIALIWIVFGQALHQQFVNFDDGTYVYRNSQVTRGISVEAIKWAFTHPVAANWHPLTILSHMLDCQWFGVAPAGHHFTNVALHSIAALLLFFAFLQMTEKLWRSAFIAAVFAIHPLHVESVAWISERKDVLSAVFFMLTLITYVHYARRRSIGRYLAVSICLALGLMAKPMLVTLPFVLLLLDYWPLGRWRGAGSKEQGAKRQGQSGKEKTTLISTSHLSAVASAKEEPLNTSTSLVLEKIPLFLLSAAVGAAAIVTQSRSINLIQHISLGSRIGNAFLSLMTYVGQTIWPQNLAVFYPYPENISGWKVVAAIAGGAALTAGALMVRRRKPYLLVGWLWFAGMLIPVIGIVQVGIQAHADRYSYLPQIGLCLMVAWTVADLSQSWRYQRIAVDACSVVAIVALAWAARTQTSYWFDSESLWKHALVATTDNETARQHLSDAYLEKGRIEDAIEQARAAVQLSPESADAHGVLGAALARSSQSDEAITQLQTALRLNPRLAQAHFNLGNVFLQRGDMTQAVSNYESELELYPKSAEAHNNLGNALLRAGRIDQAQDHFRIALSLNPRYPEAHNNMAIVLSQTGGLRDAINEWNTTLRIDSNNLEAQCNLAWVLATSSDASVRDGERAVQLTERAIKLSGGKNARIWRLAAAAQAEAGRFPEAIKAAQNGIAIAKSEGNTAVVQTLEANLRLFEQGLPLRD